MVEPQFSKLTTRVRFSSPAPLKTIALKGSRRLGLTEGDRCSPLGTPLLVLLRSCGGPANDSHVRGGTAPLAPGSRSPRTRLALCGHQGSGHAVSQIGVLNRLTCMFVVMRRLLLGRGCRGRGRSGRNVPATGFELVGVDGCLDLQSHPGDVTGAQVRQEVRRRNG